MNFVFILHIFQNFMTIAGGKVVGRIDSTKICSHFDGSTKAYLDWICVIKSYRHKGVQLIIGDYRDKIAPKSFLSNSLIRVQTRLYKADNTDPSLQSAVHVYRAL